MSQLKRIKQEYDFNLLNSNFTYDKTSPSFLRWKIDKKNQTQGSRIAGTFHIKGSNYSSWEVELLGKNYSVARIIMCLHGLNDISAVVDHIDGDTKNNAISNLRLVPATKNARNSKFSNANTSGFKGVHWIFHRGSTYAIASWRDLNGEQKSKGFSVNKFGLIPAFKMACEYRVEVLKGMNQIDGAGYTDRHIFNKE